MSVIYMTWQQRRALGIMSKSPPQDRLLDISDSQETLFVRAGGVWTRDNAGLLDERLNRLVADAGSGQKPSGTVIIDMAEIETLDTFGAYLICSASDRLKEKGLDARIEGVADKHSLLLDEIYKASKIRDDPSKPKGAFLCFVDEVLVKGIAGPGRDFLSLISFLGIVTSSLFGMVVRPGRFNMTAFVHHIEYVGFRAIPIVSLISFLIGAVIMQQGIVQLMKYGLESKAVGSSAVMYLREMGVLFTAIIVAGRSSSAFTAELGSMKMREEIDAMKTLGIDPIDSLVIPRILALVIIFPALVFLANMMCLVGGGLMAQVYLGMGPEGYLDELHKWLTLNHLFVGMVKTPFIAVAIGVIGCLEGLKVEGSAESLGGHVTSAVVKSIFIVIILDALFAILLAGV